MSETDFCRSRVEREVSTSLGSDIPCRAPPSDVGTVHPAVTRGREMVVKSTVMGGALHFTGDFFLLLLSLSVTISGGQKSRRVSLTQNQARGFCW